MPYTAKQNHLFRAIEHGWTPPAKSGIHISRKDATKMAHEGVKESEKDEGDTGKGGAAHEAGESASKEAREKKRLAQLKALKEGRKK